MARTGPSSAAPPARALPTPTLTFCAVASTIGRLIVCRAGESFVMLPFNVIGFPPTVKPAAVAGKCSTWSVFMNAWAATFMAFIIPRVGAISMR